MRIIHILLVDDDPDVLDLLGGALRGSGLGVDTARGGEEALQKLESYYPELIIADVQMPGIDGFELCRRVRASGRDDIPFFFCSALRSLPQRVAGLKIGADDYITKPVNAEELLLRVESQLEKNRRLREARQRVDAEKGFLSGDLREIDLFQLLQLLGQKGNESYCVNVFLDDACIAQIWVRDRGIAHAEYGGVTGGKAFFRALQIDRGTFRVDPTPLVRETSIGVRIDDCLLDNAAQLDEYRLLRQSLSGSGDFFFIRYSPDLFRRRFDDVTLAVLQAVEEHHSLDAILDASDYSDLVTIRVLAELQQLEIVGTTPDAKAAVVRA